MKPAEYRKIGEEIVRYLRRQHLALYNYGDHIFPDQLVELGRIGMGKYSEPSLTPNEFYDVCERVRKTHARCRLSYPLGPYSIVFRDRKGAMLTRKSEGFYSAEIAQLDITVVRRDKVTYHGGGGSTHYHRIEWNRRPSDENLMLARLAIPIDLRKYLRI
jgi:hypothetical protein